MLMDSYEAARAEVPADRWLTIRYEDIVADPRNKFAEMLDHMGLGWTPRFETRFARYDFGSGRTEAFRRDLAPADVAAMEDVAGKALARHGY
jgi:hypothetical protein